MTAANDAEIAATTKATSAIARKNAGVRGTCGRPCQTILSLNSESRGTGGTSKIVTSQLNHNFSPAAERGLELHSEQCAAPVEPRSIDHSRDQYPRRAKTDRARTSAQSVQCGW